MKRRISLLGLLLAAILLVGCAPKTVMVSSGEKVICSECGKVIRADVQTRQVPVAEVANYSVRETREVCSDCQAKIEARRQAELAASRRNSLIGTWCAPAPFGTTITLVFNSGGTGILTESGFGGNVRTQWSLNGRNLTIKSSDGGKVKGYINDDGSITVYFGNEASVFTRR